MPKEGSLRSHSIPVRIGARFALQRGPTLRPAARSVSRFQRIGASGTDLGPDFVVDRSSALIDDRLAEFGQRRLELYTGKTVNLGRTAAHVFAPLSLLPFCLAQIVRWRERWKFDWRLAAALVSPLLGVLTCLPFLHGDGTFIYPTAFQASPHKIAAFFWHAGGLDAGGLDKATVGPAGDFNLPYKDSTPDCQSNQISGRTDNKGGGFNGMSQSGTALVLRNISSTTCRLQSTVQILLKDEQNRPLNVTVTPAETAFRGPVVNGKRMPMGHGPVVLPLVLAGGAEATAALRWIAGPVFDHSVCVDVASLSVETGAARAQVPLRAHVCGPDGDHIQMKASRFTLRPVA